MINYQSMEEMFSYLQRIFNVNNKVNELRFNIKFWATINAMCIIHGIIACTEGMKL